MHNLMITAMSSSEGKTIVTCALIQTLKNHGWNVRSLKCGPDYIDPMFHQAVLDIPADNVDLFLQGKERVRERLAETGEEPCVSETKINSCGQESSGAAEKVKTKDLSMLSVLEGAMGYYDGIGAGTEGSAWEIASAFQIPALLVVRPHGSSATLAAQIRGMMEFRQPHMLCAILLNACKKSLYEFLAPLLEKETGLPVIGFLPPMEDAVLESRHLGLVTAKEIPDLKRRIEKIAVQMEETVDLDRLTDFFTRLTEEPVRPGTFNYIHKNAAPDNAMPVEDMSVEAVPDEDMSVEAVPVGTKPVEAVSNYTMPCSQAFPGPNQEDNRDPNQEDNADIPPRIAVARDEAFCFYYEGSLQRLRKCGATLLFFSPLHDTRLPEAEALYLGGGYPELYARELSENRSMREEICQAVKSGMPTIAECGGFLYLQKNLLDSDGNSWPMAGVLNGTGEPKHHLVRFGYSYLTCGQDNMLLHRGERLPVHEFHHWDCTENGTFFSAEKPSGRQWQCGFASETLYAAFPHLHLDGELPLAKRFADAARSWRKKCMDPEQQLHGLLAQISGPAHTAMEKAQIHWDSLAKPLGSLGCLEDMIVQAAGITRDDDVRFDRRELLIFCADNGVTAQGVSQTDSSVTAAVAAALAKGESTASYMAQRVNCKIIPVDIGMFPHEEIPGLKDCSVRPGTADISEEAAMSRRECLCAILQGINLVRERKAAGASILLTGEMGIGNTTTATAVACALLGEPPELLTGHGAGLSDEGLDRKIHVIYKALSVNRINQAEPSEILHETEPLKNLHEAEPLKNLHETEPLEILHKAEPLEILQKVGGLDLAALCGMCLGGAIYRVPILLDGIITLTAALCAVRMCPDCRFALLASHVSSEPAAEKILKELNLKAPIQAGLHLGEGTGALAALSLLDMALAVYQSRHTFSHLGIVPYQRL